MHGENKKFGMKWKGKLFKLVTLSLAKDGIIVADAITPTHNYYPKDGRLHTTRHPTGEKISWANLPPIENLESPVLIDQMHIGYLDDSLSEESLPNYQIINVDSFECQEPFVTIAVYAAKPNDEKIDQLKLTHRGERIIAKFANVWIALLVMDGSQSLRS
ncbi:MAG: hypothetical protein HYY37_03755 [Candidatus Aenigmarchaeota archaeon]|nr:hypothetical protein [Candidatus Aenigmarchaeota archaeon]